MNTLYLRFVYVSPTRDRVELRVKITGAAGHWIVNFDEEDRAALNAQAGWLAGCRAEGRLILLAWRRFKESVAVADYARWGGSQYRRRAV